jgi:hypothetical protein
MAQRQQYSGDTSDHGWLSSLVDTFERTELLGNIPCDATSISAARARLERPATVSPCKDELEPQHQPGMNSAANEFTLNCHPA